MRAANRIIAALLALLLTVAGFVAAIEIVAAAGGRDDSVLVNWHSWYDDLIARPWDDSAVRAVGVGLVLAGLALLLLQLLRRLPRQLRMTSGRTGLVSEVDRRSLQGSLRRTTEDVDGIARSKVRIDGSRVVVHAKSNRRDTTGLDQIVGERADDRLQTMQLEQPLSVGVGVERRES